MALEHKCHCTDRTRRAPGFPRLDTRAPRICLKIAVTDTRTIIVVATGMAMLGMSVGVVRPDDLSA